MTGSDVAGLISAINSKDGNSFFGDGIWGIIMLLIVAGIFTGGWEGNNNSTIPYILGAGSNGVTEEYIANQFNSRDLYNNNTNILTSAAATQNEILNNRYNCSQNYSNLRYETALANANLSKDVMLGNANIQSQMAQNALQAQANLDSCCCTLRTEMQQGIQSVKDLINNNTIQDLRDQLNTATIASANAVQTQNILGNIGRFYMNTPINPYYGYSSYYGTTIQ